MYQRLGKPLRPGVAYDSQGNPTTDPEAAMNGGTLSVRDGPLGTGLSIVVQLMGAVAGAPALPTLNDGFGFFITLIDPKLFGSLELYKERIDGFVKAFQDAPVKDGMSPPRIPFARSYQMREEMRKKGQFEVYSDILDQLEAMRE